MAIEIIVDPSLRQKRHNLKETVMPENPVPTIVMATSDRSWLRPVMGALAALVIAATTLVWWQSRDDSPTPTEPPPLAVTQEPQDGGTPPVDAEEPETVATAGEPPPVAPTKVEPRMSAMSTSPPATTATPPVATTTPTEPTNCTFLNGDRPKVGDKFILQCADGQHLATGTYTVDHFVWSSFEEYPPPK